MEVLLDQVVAYKSHLKHSKVESTQEKESSHPAELSESPLPNSIIAIVGTGCSESHSVRIDSKSPGLQIYCKFVRYEL